MSDRLPIFQGDETTVQPAVIPANSYILELRRYQQRDLAVLNNATEELFREAALLRRETLRLQRAVEAKSRQLASAARAAKEHRTKTYDAAYYKAKREAKKAAKAEQKARRKAKLEARAAAIPATLESPKSIPCSQARGVAPGTFEPGELEAMGFARVPEGDLKVEHPKDGCCHKNKGEF